MKKVKGIRRGIIGIALLLLSGLSRADGEIVWGASTVTASATGSGAWSTSAQFQDILNGSGTYQQTASAVTNVTSVTGGSWGGYWTFDTTSWAWFWTWVWTPSGTTTTGTNLATYQVDLDLSNGGLDLSAVTSLSVADSSISGASVSMSLTFSVVGQTEALHISGSWGGSSLSLINTTTSQPLFSTGGFDPLLNPDIELQPGNTYSFLYQAANTAQSNDNFRLRTASVPEPAASALLATGLLAWSVRYRLRRYYAEWSLRS